MVKKRIKLIPVLGPIALTVYIKLVMRAKFTTSAAYWEKRYKKGGNSGDGSYDHLAEYKGEIINGFVAENEIKSVIELGCGDGNQLRHFHLPAYLGFDISRTAIERCRNIYKDDPSKRFELFAAYNNEKADLALSLDVIYHLVEDDVFHTYMVTLFAAPPNL